MPTSLTELFSPACHLCPRRCGAARDEGARGVCGANDTLRVARAALHMWEEPPISGEAGSGTIFFSGCSLKCIYCQNHEISTGNFGLEISPERLVEIMLELQDQGANNINLVTATHYAHLLPAVIAAARARGLVIPIVYNTSGYERASAVAALGDLVDVWLTDFKYANAGFLTSLGIFNIKQANNIEVYKGSTYLQQDGEQEYQGIELSVNGKLADKWNFMGGLMYLDATQNKTQNGTNDGKTVNGAAKWNAVAVLEYNPDEKFSIVGRAMYTGKADIYNEQLQTPSYMTYDLGVNYKTAFNKTPVTLTAMCYNLTDKNYWTAYGNNLILSSPRTLMLSATFDI